MKVQSIIIGGPFIGAFLFGFFWPDLQTDIKDTLLQIPAPIAVIAAILLIIGAVSIKPLVIPGAAVAAISGGFALGFKIRTG